MSNPTDKSARSIFSSETDPRLVKGARAMLVGLEQRRDLNMAEVELLAWHADVGRWAVRVVDPDRGGPPNGMRVKPECLQVYERRPPVTGPGIFRPSQLKSAWE